ncbi:MAG: hypothetical protein BGO38_00030 [Cellulomonas sp. 73-145]|uniref:hypothetical protein n=1 Tax=Cellulomonas sp. 73-145 TaxID=1895739 RepID=UPI00092B06A0|nr:hypothetical protein [Cellulomonas sp. 73-145]MBN9327620.1 hypothetical protein [Cellulomonas sp.]OJV59996.1 MAG: hypothetical protein BGO38_00030 [Cellulomonas sp. 73-145]
MASRRRNVWSAVFGETIMTWPRIAGQQLVAVTLVVNAVLAHSGWLRWAGFTLAAVTQVWILYDASRRLEATHRARQASARRSPQAIADDRGK